MNARGAAATLAAIHGFVGVAVGAVGAHVVAEADYRPLMTGAGMQLAHALAALLALALLRGRGSLAVAWSFVIGSLLFAGAIYIRVFAGLPGGQTAPSGGILLMLGWLLFAVGAARSIR